MLLSQQYKILYVAVPKTATTTVQNWLLKESLGFNKGEHIINDHKIWLREHITASKAKELLGSDYYDKLNVIAFIRHPYSKIISSYHFYRGGGKRKTTSSIKNQKNKKRRLHIFQILSTRLLPFWLWAIIYPYKDNKQYCVDHDNNVIVDYIGVYENLVNDLELFLNELNLDADINNLSYLNKSKKNKSDDIIKNKMFQKILLFRHKKLKGDLEFYQFVLSKQDLKR